MSWSAWLGSIYPDEAAATRLRLTPLKEPIAALGGTARDWSFLSASAYERWMSGRPLPRIAASAHGLREIPPEILRARAATVAVVQRELLPLNNLVFERSLDIPFVWDVDDFLWTASAAKGIVRGRAGKFRWLCRNAAEVWAGNRSVADWCVREGATRVELVLASVPIPERVAHPQEPYHLAWVGTPSTGPFVEKLLHQLEPELRDFEIDVVGARIDPPVTLKVNQHEWSLAVEESILSRAWAGLYPIDTTHPMAPGKSALKAALYMSYGVPVIATRTPSNADVVEDGVEGYLVSDLAEWRQAVSTLRDSRVRARLSIAARSRAIQDFDSSRRYTVLAERLASLAQM